jgi:hypothetical protein
MIFLTYWLYAQRFGNATSPYNIRVHKKITIIKITKSLMCKYQLVPTVNYMGAILVKSHLR